MPESTSKDGRSRNYATIVYPESAPEDWIEILQNLKVPTLISPEHNMDVNPDGEIKKEHYHVLLKFSGKKSKEQVLALCQQFGGVGCETVNNFRSYARYLCHLDNPEKAQYEVSDVLSFNGIDYITETGTPADKYKAVREMMAYCRQHKVYSYAKLLDYASEEREDWFRILCDNGTYVIKEYLKSCSWTKERDDRN